MNLTLKKKKRRVFEDRPVSNNQDGGSIADELGIHTSFDTLDSAYFHLVLSTNLC